MQPIFYVMAILGCGDAGTGCETVRTAPTLYASPMACRAAASDVLLANADLDYPMLRIVCRKAARQAVLRSAS
ncbi:hypothetical protein [Sphingomonas colocasiae]|uniref:Secreted protein n=1 Tax=Sphingomonas colocasiae TaxID=1848973 RepID=A0ABS7PTZ2_9SPHN|nr:hypothetical protein [Sphingomonas colocasiae]MBY8824743.1 hypothetical protein [Sphingomonas colocasiae]